MKIEIEFFAKFSSSMNGLLEIVALDNCDELDSNDDQSHARSTAQIRYIYY